MSENNPPVVDTQSQSTDNKADAKTKLKEGQQMLKIVEQFELAYNKQKQNYNKLDGITMNNMITVKSLLQCIRTNKKNLQPEDPDWDTEDFEASLVKLNKEVEETNAAYGVCKNKEMTLSEQIINKDSSAFKLHKVEKIKKQQDDFYKTIDQIDDGIYKQQKESEEIWDKYENFNEALFKKKYNETKELIEKTNKVKDETNSQLEELKEEMDKVLADQKIVEPFNDDQKKFYKKISIQVGKCNQTLKDSVLQMEKEAKKQEILDKDHEECGEIVEVISKMNEANDLVHLSKETEKLVNLCDNYKDFNTMHDTIDNMLQNEIIPARANVKEQMAQLQEFIAQVKAAMKIAFDNLIHQIETKANQNGVETEAQHLKLRDFEERNVEHPDNSNNIPHADILYLKKEISRYDISVAMVLSIKSSILENCLQLERDRKKSESEGDDLILMGTIDTLRNNLTVLQTQSTLEIPRIQKNIEQLEAFLVKHLKQHLNDENKVSQANIASMKARFDTYTKYLDSLNEKVTTVRKDIADLNEKFNDEDLEKENEFITVLENEVNFCDQEINGDKNARQQEAPKDDNDGGYFESKANLIMRKKIIISDTNKLVNTFNENNKLIKESNIQPKTDVQIHEIITKNRELQKFCASIDNKITEATDKGVELEAKLDKIPKITIPALTAKYDTKNETIDQCDHIFDQNEAKVNELEETLKAKAAETETVIQQVVAVSPLTNPALPTGGNDAFIKQVAELLGRAHTIRDDLENVHKRLINQQDKLMDDIQPLNELGEREVKQEEVVEIMEKMKALSETFADLENNLKPLVNQLETLVKDVDDTVAAEKGKTTGAAQESLGSLDAKLKQIEDLKTGALEKLKEYNDGIEELKETEGAECPILLDTLGLLSEEAKAIGENIADLDAQMAALNEKKNEHKVAADDAGANPTTFTPKQIEELNGKLDDTHALVDKLLDKDQAINDDLDKRIEELKHLKANNGAFDNLKVQGKELGKGLKQQLLTIKDILASVPEQIEGMRKSLEEQKKDTEPDKLTADYFEKKKVIDQQIKTMNTQQAAADKVQQSYPALEKNIEDCKTKLDQAKDIDTQKAVIEEYNKLNVTMTDNHTSAVEIKETVANLRKEMGDCQIPANIAKRATELAALHDLFVKIQGEFQAYKAEHRTNLKENEYEKEIREIIDTLVKKLDEQDNKKRDLNKFQKNTLEKYTEPQFMENDNSAIIIEVREHKERIRGVLEEIKELEQHFYTVMDSKDKFHELNDSKIECDTALDDIAKILDSNPQKIVNLLATLGEMLKSSEPGPHDEHCGHTPDYFDSKDKVLAQIKLLQDHQQRLQKIDDDFANKEDKVDELIAKSREVDDNAGLEGVNREFKKEVEAIKKMQKIANDTNDTVAKLEEELHDCGIPISVGKRIDDLAQFDDGLNDVIEQFDELKGHDDDEELDDDFINPDTEAEIRKLVVQIDKEIYGFQVEQKEFQRYQTEHVEAYTPDHHKDHSMNAGIIAEIREHKHAMQDAIRRLHDLDLHVKDSILRKQTYEEINDLVDTCNANFCALLEMNQTLPKEITDSLATLAEMLNGTHPDETADYFDQRQQIEEWIYSFKQTNENIAKIKKSYLKQKVEFETLVELGKKETDINGIIHVKESFDKQVEIIDGILSQADGCNETVLGIKEKMAYCSIPENITRRANEIEDFKKKLQNIQIDFFDFKIDYAKSSSLSVQSKIEIKKIIDQIDQKLFGFDEDRKGFSNFLKQKLELYTSRDYMNNNKAPGIIVEIREFQAKIQDANERLKKVLLFIEDCKQKKGHHQMINNVCKDMEVDIGNLQDFLKTCPNDIKHLLETLEEMKIGSYPDKNADYFEQRDQIGKHTSAIKDVEAQLESVETEFNAKQQSYKELRDGSQKLSSNEELQKTHKLHENQKKEFAIILAKANKCRETTDYIKTNMDECEIPYTINLRSDEVEKFCTKLERITGEFQELKTNDFEDCNSDTKASIRKLIDEMIQKLTGFEDDKEDFTKFQKGTLEQYSQKDFIAIKNAHIIKEIREHKLKIYDSNWRLGELEDFLRTAKAQKISLLQIDGSHKQLQNNLGNLSNFINEVPKEIDLLRKTLEQMQLATIPLKGFPNDKADYASQAAQIQKYLDDLDKYEAIIINLHDDHKTKTEDHKELKSRSAKELNVTALVNISQEFNQHHEIVNSLFDSAQDLAQKVQTIKTALDDCSIPINIELRAKEIRRFQEKLIVVNDSFIFLQKCLHVDTDQKIVQDFNQKLQGFREDQKSFVKTQNINLEVLTKDDFLNQSKQVEVIPLIKSHKDKITDATARLKELEDLINKTIAQQHSHGNITQNLNDIKSNIEKIREVLKTLPDKIEKMLLTNNEMKNGSEPDDTADYWDERTAIASNITELISAQNKLHDIEELVNKKESDVKNLVTKSKKTNDNETLTKIENGISSERDSVEEILNQIYDISDDVQTIKEKMGECEISVNIAMRANEIEHFITKLDRIEEDFKDLKQADEDFEGSSSSEADIKKLINEFGPKLDEFQQDKRKFNKYQQNKLNRYETKDFESYDNAPIIVEIRQFKEEIAEAMEKLKDLDALNNELNNLLILQDIENASRLLEQKNNKLRERLELAQTDLKKIDNCGNEMDGNCSRNEEEEFIEALKDEMPDVFNNITGNFEQIDKIQSILVEIKQSKSIDLLQTLKSEVDDATQKVEQCEGLVNKLENEIIEWDAQKKLCRRDEELEEIDNLLKDFQNDLTAETDQMYPKLEQNTRKLEASTSAQDVEDFQKLVEGIKEYIADVEKLGLEVNYLLEEKDECFDEFDGDIPTNIKNEREVRRKAKNLTLSPRSGFRGSELKSSRSNGGEKNKPNEKFYMIHINCKYRKRIHEMLKNLRELNKKRRELEDKWGPFKRELNKVKEVKVYKAIKGDAIDELFAFHLNKHQLNLPIKRIGPGKYLFGTKQILAKIINGKLVIRVGGGYMSADEFIEQYGPMEILKMQQNEDRENDDEEDNGSKQTMNKRNGSANQRMSMRQASGSPRTKGTDMANMKAQMRQTLNANVKIYDNDHPGQGSPKNLLSSPKSRKSISNIAGSPKRGSPKAQQ